MSISEIGSCVIPKRSVEARDRNSSLFTASSISFATGIDRFIGSPSLINSISSICLKLAVQIRQ